MAVEGLQLQKNDNASCHTAVSIDGFSASETIPAALNAPPDSSPCGFFLKIRPKNDVLDNRKYSNVRVTDEPKGIPVSR